MNQLRHTKAAGLSEPALLCLSFVTIGASDPTEFRGPIESVTRLTDAGGEVFYRVRVLESAEFYEPVRAFAQPCVVDGVGTRLLGYIRDDAAPVGDDRVASREIDIAVRDEVGGAFTNSLNGAVISVWAMIENSAASIT